MEGGITFDAVSASVHARDAGLTMVFQARSGRTQPFERRLSTKADFELGKSAWNATSRIWGTSKSFLDGTVDDEQMRRTLKTPDAAISTDPPLASPVRQGSLSNYVSGKAATSSLRTPTELNNENALPSKMPWGSVSSSIGFSSRQRGLPLSPTKPRQPQYPEFVSNGPYDQSSLFVGSDPDVDERPSDVQHLQHHRRLLAGGSRTIPSPTRTATFGSNPLDPQIQALNSSRFQTNGVFAQVQEYEHDRSMNGFLQIDGVSDSMPGLNDQDTLMNSNGRSSENLYRHDSRLPTEGRANHRLINPEHLNNYRPPAHQDYDDVMRSFEAMHVNQMPAGPVSHRTAFTQPQIQRELFSPAHLNQLDSSFRPTNANAPNIGSRLNPQATPHYGGFQYAGRGSLPPLSNDYRSSLNSPYYSATGTPPTGPQSIRSTPGSGVSSRTSHHDPFLFERGLVDVDHYGYDPSNFGPSSGQASMANSFQYDVQLPGHEMRMNPLANPYVGHGQAGMQNYPSGPRMPVRDPEQPHIIRSPLLEDFRLNSKNNRRFELKDIYGYVVEFSGDQHGSRFIQQKLETANSDEKEQIFKEIQPNLLQLMTDVFGNYVIQKMFEHGNQSQKKILAHHMKGHVLNLSMQMYGCRVVQKAFEHVLTDQQAILVKELDGLNLQILKVVKDQNGNHVVQKAIERVPGEHIQFIVDAHRGQLAKMSTHQYGCRVVQRMLEHCQPPAKRAILDELLEHIHPLISDSYGNYVVQHIIQNGEPRDRRQVVDIILSQLLGFCKHKFASNIVEKSLDCADEDQREQILRGMIGANELGVTPVLGLMRDQYGNYVLRKFPGAI